MASARLEGTTMVGDDPVEATVRVLRRSSDPQVDGVIVAEVQSAPDGTWIAVGLESGHQYDVVARRAGFNDVIMANVTPVTD